MVQNDQPSFSASSVKLKHGILYVSHILGIFLGEFLSSSVITAILYFIAVAIKNASPDDFVFVKFSNFGCSFTIFVTFFIRLLITKLYQTIFS